MRLCIQCKYGVLEESWRCRHEYGVDPVDGAARLCAQMRYMSDLCGRSGVLFVARPSEQGEVEGGVGNG